MQQPPSAESSQSAWTEEMIQQCAQETGFPPEQVKADIERTGAQTKEQLYSQFYSGQGIEPSQGETVAPGTVQGQMPQDPGTTQPPPATAPPPPEAGEGEPPQAAPAEVAEREGIDPAVMQQLHDMMRPKKR